MTRHLRACAMRGNVLVSFDPDTARDFAQAFSTAYATCADLEDDRPDWFTVVNQLFQAADRADEQNGAPPSVVHVPFYPQMSAAQPGGEASTATDEADRGAGATSTPAHGSPVLLTLVQGGVS